MTERMPDFAMPTDEELAAERRAEAIARARAADPSSALRERLGLEQEPIDEATLDAAALADDGAAPDRDGAQPGDASSSDPATRIPSRRADRSMRVPSAARRRALAVLRNPVVAFAIGATMVAAGFLAAPTITAWTERGSLAELQRIVDDYEDAVNAGDVEAALALHRPGGHAASMALLDAGVAPTIPPNVSCDVREPSGQTDVAVAQCSLAVARFGASGQPVSVRLERTDGSWRIASGLEQPAYVEPRLFEIVSIAGVSMDGLLEPGEPAYWLLPGAYDIETRTSEHVELTDYGGLLVGDGGGYLNVSVQPGDALVAEVEAAALAYAQACVADEASAASCRIVPPPAGRELTATLTPQGWPADDVTLASAVRIGGSGEVAAPIVEVLVRFDETLTSYEIEVSGVTEMYG